jgi:myo-inositol-1-phosphate synthase
MEGLFFPLVLAWALPGTFPHAHQPRAATWAAVERGSAGGVVASCGRRSGMLCVGLAGNNGVTLVAAQLANQRRLTWESDRRGPQQASLLGCITQVGQLAERYAGLDAFCDMAIGGWDIRALPLGQGLYESRILDYDLVRQLRDEMDQTAVMPGVWDASFIGDSQHEGATHTVPAAPKAELLDHLRGDIRRWREAEEVRGHVTLVWSASVERPSQFEPQTAEALLAAIRSDEPEVSPSLLYATAAVLEGCSFINGGSQNTLQPGLLELASQQPSPVYVLGTDFKAGQTKAKTALVEYLRAIGLRLSTVASYNHLGNNDMRNLLSPSTWKAKARVKSDIFGAWVGAPRSPGAEEGSGANAGAADGSVRAAFKPQNNLDTQIDHKVAVLFTEAMGDEKRDTVEYTSLAFMGCEHTMLTYTRCMDSALCVPLMIDAVVFADYFAARGVAASEVRGRASFFLGLERGGKGEFARAVPLMIDAVVFAD